MPTGSVLGIDMTDEQLQTANASLEHHREKTGLSNVEFLKGDLENLQALEDEGEHYDRIEEIWPDYPRKDDFFFNEDEY